MIACGADNFDSALVWMGRGGVESDRRIDIIRMLEEGKEKQERQEGKNGKNNVKD